jgi:hypothetical protein
MLPEQTKNLALEIAHVLFMDIIGYSKLLLDEQTQCLEKLQEIVRSTEEFRCAKPQEQLLRLPTGDGMALVFFGNALAPVRCAMEISRSLKSRPEIELRMGVHSGPVSRIVDINGNVNVAGEGINFAQRVMDAGGRGHILLSKAVADVLCHLRGWKEHLHDLGQMEVKHGVLIHVFNLYTGECGNPDPPASAGRMPTVTPAQPSLGPFVSKLCNRSPQVREFTDFFIAKLKTNAGMPLFCFIPGEERECHDSLVERLVHVHIKPIAARIWGAQRGIAVYKKIVWPHTGEKAERRHELVRNLFAEFDPAYMDDDMSAAALSRLASLLLSPLVIIQHNVYGGRWDERSRGLLEWYLDYWDEVATGHVGPQFILFVNVLYPKASARRRWRLWPLPRHADKNQIQADLQHLCVGPEGGCPRLLLKELISPQQHEVSDWFSQHNIYDVKTRVELLGSMFDGAGQVTMADIEHELQRIHRDFIRKRGI